MMTQHYVPIQDHIHPHLTLLRFPLLLSKLMKTLNPTLFHLQKASLPQHHSTPSNEPTNPEKQNRLKFHKLENPLGSPANQNPKLLLRCNTC